MSVSASKGGVRLLAACAAINMTLAAIGWFWQGGYVSSALLDKVARSGTLTLGSWNWNTVHLVLWALWLSGWFALLAARFQIVRLNGPRRRRLALTIAAAGAVASLLWLASLLEVARHLSALDGGRLLSGGVSAWLVRWTAVPLAVGAAVAIVHFVLMLRWKDERLDVDAPASDLEHDASAPGRAGDVSPPSPTELEPSDVPSSDVDDAELRTLRAAKRKAKRPAEKGDALRTLQVGMAALSLAGFGLFWQFLAFGPAETTWSLDRLFSGPAAEGWAALSFLVLAHVGHLLSAALTLFDRERDAPLSGASGGRKSPVSATHDASS
ncbi:MAG TPA: hypothetical protein VGN57_23290 [Pirellulaceae bacterium]|nr:hypothetical protein [Pirellulaceae bacterium]